MFLCSIRIAYREVTVGNHIYYARYLDLLEVARNEAFRDLGHSLFLLQEKGIIFPVVECSLRYHAAARYDDLLKIETRVVELGRVQFVLDYRVLREETLLLTASTRHACTNLKEKPMRMPPDLFEALSRHRTAS